VDAYNSLVAAGGRFLFDQFELDPERRRLTRSGEPIAVSLRHLDVLLLLVARAGHIVAKDDLVRAGWKDVAVSDNSLEQAISSLRRIVGRQCIETVPRRGYRFGVVVERETRRETDRELDALLAPHRAFIEGRAALETLEVHKVARARQVFETALSAMPDHPSPHIGLANACAMQFEMTRADPAPDIDALATGVRHAREACRLDPESGEAWATLGFVLDRMGQSIDAAAAARRAAALEPDNWRHHFRLSFVSWGDERLRSAHRTLALLPGFPLAHYLAATVHVARQALGEAERELTAGLRTAGRQARFNAVALHWLAGLVLFARGDEAEAVTEFEMELGAEHAGHLYARECCANTWYAIGALRWHQGRLDEARFAFQQAISRVAGHAMAQVGLAAASGRLTVDAEAADAMGRGVSDGSDVRAFDAAMVRAARLQMGGSIAQAANVVERALDSAPGGSAGWILPVEPLFHVRARPEIWAASLALVRNRAA
jgi:DNA-binding winged helix-turn-helix (wHTH) protein